MITSGAEDPANASGDRASLSDFARLLRPKQWTKNLIALMPVLFSGHLHETPLLLKALLCVVSFCAASSAIYIVNDLSDQASDRLHPKKKERPIASGRVTAAAAITLSIVLIVAAAAVAFFVRPTLTLVVAAYVVLMILYSLILKHIALLDVFSIAAGFVLRAVGGAVAVSVPSSGWFLVCTSFGALFLALEKRRQEINLLGEEAGSHRKSLSFYSKELLDRLEGIIVPSLVTCYAFYSFLSYHGQAMLLTMPFVVYGLMRYQLLSTTGAATGAPEEVLLKDRPIQITVILWLATCAAVVYGLVPAVAGFVSTQLDNFSLYR
jgi:4-hydroxybenzoate polyprenyltransferase